MSESVKPNILWICTDQQRYDSIRKLGNEHIRTPNLDRLAENGIAFTEAYTQSPLCSPSRASFLTGRYPRTTRVTKVGNEYFPEDEVLVTKLLADEGYSCGLVGKFHLSANNMMPEKRPANDGYDFYKWFNFTHVGQKEHDVWGKENAYLSWLSDKGVSFYDHYKEGNRDSRKFRELYDGFEDVSLHPTAWCIEEAKNFIESRQDRPWLLSLNIFDPHPPFDAPKEYSDRYPLEDVPLPKWKEGELDNKPSLQKADYIKGGQDGVGPPVSELSDDEKREYISNYYGMVEMVDEYIGKLLDYMEELGQLDNTMIIFHTDHGEMLGDHGLIYKGAYFYQELVHNPLIISYPKKFKVNSFSNALVELVDIAPTILEAAGLEVPYYMQGKSLLPLLTGEAELDYHKDSVYCEYYYALTTHAGVYATMYYDGQYKLVVYHGDEVGELYDLKNDPNEFENLWANPEYEQLKAQLILKSFDRTVRMVDPKPKFVGYY
ncbi:sulfatase family protein [Bacillus sp. B-jedd]|uniref:sulfatase family protein n=1 Tax=Bacillus sp. B-jedd TaxID=1476857 RepID=UPI0005155993|nr:sulfatase-like hydrolase/transferase [Bacillus sp. B-jedd]CEG29406.1 sulfatase [Bacillus sp. B-jedd]